MNSPRMMDHTIENPYHLHRLPISEVVDTEHEQVWKSPTKLIVTVRFIIQYASFLFGGYSSNIFKMTVFQDGASVVHQKTATKPPARVPSWPGEWGCLAGTLEASRNMRRSHGAWLWTMAHGANFRKKLGQPELQQGQPTIAYMLQPFIMRDNMKIYKVFQSFFLPLWSLSFPGCRLNHARSCAHHKWLFGGMLK